MQSRELISVVIPTYNRAKDLMIAIDSVLKQSYPVLEILVCDDGSNDQSKELVLAINNSLVKWIDCGKNGGPAIPRNIGIKQSKGNWIAFLDSDDEWQSNKVEEQISQATKLNCKAVSSNAYKVKANSKKTNYLEFDNTIISFEDLLKTNFVICSSMMVHRSVFDIVNGFPEKTEFVAIEDYCLWLKVTTLTPIAYVNKPLVNYLDNPTLSIRANDKSVAIQRKLILKELISWLNLQSFLNKEDYIRLVKFAMNEPKRNFRKQQINKLKNFVKYFLRK